MTFKTVRAIGLKLPGVVESTAYGSPALKLNGKMLACIATNKAADPNTLVVMIDFADRDALIEEEPETYYLRDHYVGYPSVLIRLSRARPEAIRDLLAGAYRKALASSPKPKARAKGRPRSR